MSRVNVLYKVRKDEIYHFYSHFDKLDNDSITEANDHIVDVDLKREHFENELEEFFNTTAMCNYMIEHDLYDEYFFSAFDEILEDYEKLQDDFLDNDSDKKLFETDVDNVKDYLIKEESNKEYYDNLSSIYERELESEDR